MTTNGSGKHQQLHAVVHGRVQGVSFRYYTLNRANELGLVGWVRNLEDRSVEVLAEGPRHALDELLDFLNQGPPSARVSHVDIEWSMASGYYDRFEIR
jgi:acylphosphatase